MFGAVYLLTAVKRVRGMRLVGTVWKHSEERARRLTPVATTRVALTTAEAHSAIVLDDEAAANDARCARDADEAREARSRSSVQAEAAAESRSRSGPTAPARAIPGPAAGARC